MLAISVSAIYLALLFQFNNAIKPFLVFAAAPYGVAGAFIALWIMNTSFGFMAFLGIASLIGVIVSHVIVSSTSLRRCTPRASRSNRR